MRHDIQLLRGIAVLAVVFYHAKIWPFSNGYLGVDIFFVISGFLITSIVLKGLGNNNFSFSKFYLRRARRLLPALFCTLFGTTVAAYIFLTDRQWTDFQSQLYGALSFTSNMVLPFQVGYFDDAAETKPLLHIWSLSLEEQFYLLIPFLLFVAPRKSRGLTLLLLAVTSFIACQIFMQKNFVFSWAPGIGSVDWAFYLLPTRAWELLIGSMLAWWMLKHPQTEVPKPLKIGALFSLLGLLCYSIDATALRGDTIAAVLLTATLLAGQDNWLPRWSIARLIEKVGDWSYSLYLVHWPLLAFAQVSFLGVVPQGVNMSIACVSLVLAFLQYQYVEQRFRRTPGNLARDTITYVFVSTVAIVALSLHTVVSLILGTTDTQLDFEEFRRNNVGFGRGCAQEDNWIQPEICTDSASPSVAVWGDSLAMHLVPGLRQNTETQGSLLQITKSSCNPIKGLAAVDRSEKIARQCINFNNRALNHILSSDSIEKVIISSPFGYFYGHGKPYLYQGKVVDRNANLATSVLIATIKSIQESGKQVIIISPLPSADFNVGDCLERQATGAIVLGRENCNIHLKKHTKRRKPVISALQKVEIDANIRIIWLDRILCDKIECRTEIEGTPLYRDNLHLSIDGSEILLHDISLFED